MKPLGETNESPAIRWIVTAEIIMSVCSQITMGQYQFLIMSNFDFYAPTISRVLHFCMIETHKKSHCNKKEENSIMTSTETE